MKFRALGFVFTLALFWVWQFQSSAQTPVFEAASLKRSSNEPFVGIGVQPGGLFTAHNVTLQLLIQFANRLQAFQVIGGPDWIRADRFDVEGKSPANAGPGDVPLMVRVVTRGTLHTEHPSASSTATCVRISNREK